MKKNGNMARINSTGEWLLVAVPLGVLGVVCVYCIIYLVVGMVLYFGGH